MNEEEKEHLRLVEKEIPYTSARDFGHLFNQQLQMLTLKQLNPYIDFVKVKVSQSCPALCATMDYTVHGIFQVRILEWVAIPFSR